MRNGGRTVQKTKLIGSKRGGRGGRDSVRSCHGRRMRIVCCEPRYLQLQRRETEEVEPNRQRAFQTRSLTQFSPFAGSRSFIRGGEILSQCMFPALTS